MVAVISKLFGLRHIEMAEDIVIQLVLCRHRLGLIVRNPRESPIEGDALLPVLQPKVGNHLRGIGRGRPAEGRGGKTKHQPQQQGLPRQNDYLGTGHNFSPAPSQPGSLGGFNPKSRGKSLILLVGAAGFEPTTCSTQNCRATRLRYTPIMCWEMRRYTLKPRPSRRSEAA